MTEPVRIGEITDIGGPRLMLRQIGSVVAMEARKILRPAGSLPVYLLAALPVAVAVLTGVFGPSDGMSVPAARQGFAGVFHGLILGATVFFGCALVFTNLFRGDILRRSLHFYLLAPIRRDALLLGKYVAGLLAAWLLFGGATLVSCLVLYWPLGIDGAIDGGMVSSLFADLGVTLLGCVGYGALFLLFGLLFRNPILPVAALLAWDGLHFLLPPALQALSVRYHLGALTSVPMPPSGGVLAILATPPSASVAVASLLVLAIIALGIAVVRLRRLEIRYTED